MTTQTDVKEKPQGVQSDTLQKKSPAAPEKGKPRSVFVNDIVFDVKFRGFDRDQVCDYIDKLTVDYNRICKRCAALETENIGLRTALATLYQYDDGGAER